jgi:Na+/H+ antiporter NhaD/arsenite permease-like protein
MQRIALVGDVALELVAPYFRKEGYEVKNKDFFRIGIPFTLAAIIPAYIYLWIFYGV